MAANKTARKPGSRTRKPAAGKPKRASKTAPVKKTASARAGKSGKSAKGVAADRGAARASRKTTGGFNAGDSVAWKGPGDVTGKVVKKVTRPTRVKGHNAEATPEEPQYLVRSDKTGAEAVHKPESLRKVGQAAAAVPDKPKGRE
jgi:hypothetical protein